MNAQIRDNEIHIAGSLGFTAAPSTARGIEPASGYFMGGTAANLHVEAGSGAVSTGGTAFSFANAYSGAPTVVICEYSTSAITQNNLIVSAVSTTGFTAKSYSAGRFGAWISLGAD
jgi:hypothetical protein